ncbi:MAG: RyR domain-containing protein [Aristaeellaceae bacterium]
MNHPHEDSGAWIPQPPDLSGIQLTPVLERLSEQLARSIHEIWAQARIQNGWSYGPSRNDELKQTPCLTSYEALPEEERRYDQTIAHQTLQMILQLGFDITPSNPDSGRRTD